MTSAASCDNTHEMVPAGETVSGESQRLEFGAGHVVVICLAGTEMPDS